MMEPNRGVAVTAHSGSRNGDAHATRSVDGGWGGAARGVASHSSSRKAGAAPVAPPTICRGRCLGNRAAILRLIRAVRRPRIRYRHTIDSR